MSTSSEILTEFDEIVRRVTERLEPEISRITLELIRLSREVSLVRRRVDSLPLVDIDWRAGRQLVGADTGAGIGS